MEQPKLETLPAIINDPALLMAQIRQFVKQCHEMLEQGDEPDLTGLDDQVKILCDHIRAMDLKAAETLRPRMESMVEEFNGLLAALHEQRKKVMAQLNELTRQQQANTAYQKVESSVPRPDYPHEE